MIDSARKGAGPLLLEDVLRELLDSNFVGTVPLIGDFGAGKSTAVLAMRERFVGEERLVLADETVGEAPPHAGTIVLHAGEEDAQIRGKFGRGGLRMAPWTRDDMIEYLLAAHPKECASVVARLPNVEVYDFFRGLPGLWRPVLDEMASDESVQATVKALLHVLAREWPDAATWRACADAAAREVFGATAWPSAGKADETQQPYLRYEPVRLVLGVQRFFERLVNDKDATVLASRVPPILLSRLGQDLARHDEARALVEAALVGTDATLHRTAASVLNACDRMAVKGVLVGFGPLHVSSFDLREAQLEEIDLAGVVVQGLDLRDANLAGASFEGARIAGSAMIGAILDRVSFRSCRIEQLDANVASCRETDFTLAELSGAIFHSARMHRASFDRAQLSEASLFRATLAQARFLETNLREADLIESNVDGALFRDVDFEGALLDSVDFRRCTIESTKLAHTYLRHAKLEGVQLPDGSDFSGADFTGAHLTGCRMQRANLRDARLNETGLADVDFEGADLRGADFTNASFHLGSSRSGLVFDQPPMEGTRTGFYTDEMSELAHKAPEEIRKANLRGCDLRGAKIETCDFYLVDLRDAQLDPAQLEHVRRCGAILRRRE